MNAEGPTTVFAQPEPQAPTALRWAERLAALIPCSLLVAGFLDGAAFASVCCGIAACVFVLVRDALGYRRRPALWSAVLAFGPSIGLLVYLAILLTFFAEHGVDY